MLPPRLTVDSGDWIVYRTSDAGWGERPPGQPLDQPLRRRHPGHTGHALSGPVDVRGAQPGETLQIDIGTIVPRSWGLGVHRPGLARISGILGGRPDDVERLWLRHYHLDATRQAYPFGAGIEVPVAPFMGIFAVAPDDDGPVPTAHPGPHGGNMDCKELRSGTTLYLPILVPGALFSVGDGHGAQGDGEVDGAAVETGMDRLELRLTVRKDVRIERPRAETPTHLLFLGFHEDLDEAAVIATRDAMSFLCQAFDLTWDEAYNFASLALDLRVTQVVDGLKGIHAMLPKACFTDRVPTFAATD
jgi:acetamidase/formamidase